MLEIKKITKIYDTAGFKQKALNEVSINFRKCEFVSILGPSGSGKTTLLNIIGGLDKYTSGDLIINGRSTKKYNDRDWDTYRNHKIGFVFQSYNLIPHQTILANVELALTLSGVSKLEREKRAKDALKTVGLLEHISKKPNQLSGGQMQRVAIARALVNNPDILLADEPTGALDSKTSTQIMDLLKDVAKDRLVIMVTHNGDLAKEYSTRIIELKDGVIKSDSNPFKDNKKEAKGSRDKKTNMSFFTAFGLSFNNLMTKKGRTILVAFAGSIGIIGIALISSLSTGFQNYIDKLQEDTLSSYPLTIMEESTDITSMLLSMTASNRLENPDGTVREEKYISSMLSSIKANDLRSFKNYFEKNYDDVKKDLTSVKYTYSVDPAIYTIDATKKLAKVNPNNLFSSMYGNNSMMGSFSSFTSIFSQMIDDQKSLDEQYEVLAGSWPKEYDEMVIVLSEPSTISDLLVYSLGLRDTEELTKMISKIMSGETIDNDDEPLVLSYEDLMNIELKLIKQTDVYKYNSKYNIYEDMSEDDAYMKKLYDNALRLKIVGVVCPKEGITSMTLNPGVAYKSSLIDYIIKEAEKTDIVKKQIENEKIDVFSNSKFDSKKKSNIDFEDLISVDTKMLQSAFDIKISQDDITKLSAGYMNDINNAISVDVSGAKKDFSDNFKKLSNNLFNSLGEQVSLSEIEDVVNSLLDTSESKNILSSLEREYAIPFDTFKMTYSGLLKGLLQAYIVSYTSVDNSLTVDPENPVAMVNDAFTSPVIDSYMNSALVLGTIDTMAKNMQEVKMKKEVLSKVGELMGSVTSSIASGFKVDEAKIAKAFKFNLTESELARIMGAMGNDTVKNANSNLISLGYQDKEKPTLISFYFSSFDNKEHFLDFIDSYNDKMEAQSHDEKAIKYTDATGILMGSVKKIVNSVSYVLIAFVSISLIVSSIMIGIITYISVFERTKEIGILRSIGASKRNISTIFNAETFIIGLLSGLLGVGVTYALIPIINYTIHTLTGNNNISATLAITSAGLLTVLSIILTLIGGLIPSKKASKKDPVEALRSE